VAISPNIPTSFVPRQTVDTNRRKIRSGTDILLIGSLILLALTIAAAGAIYGYQLYLQKVSVSKAQDLQKAQAAIDQSTVEGFVRLSSRLANAKTILDQHIFPSQFFDLLENLTLQSVHFNTLTFTLNKDKSASIDMNGVAKNFNALAAQSAAFANEKRIKHAIFSGFSVNKDNSVSFELSAELDPKLVLSVGDASATSAGVTGSTTSITPSTSIAPVTSATTAAPVRAATTTSPFGAAPVATPAPATTPVPAPIGTTTPTP
jgi:hypothetical protein